MWAMEKGKVRIGSIVIDVKDFPRMMAFWQETLGYSPKRPPTPGDPFVILKDPSGEGPNVSIDGMEPYRNRLHLDLYTDDPDGEIERLLRLGATVFRPREPDEDFVVLADPEGNLFCVVDTRGS
jgi:predicted enzyme related to lactoylglutathione lyase